METPIRFAFAVGLDEKIGNEHFGLANKFLIYETSPEGLKFLFKKENDTGNAKVVDKYGLKQKADSIIKLLRELNVNVLVSRQFGPNIRLVNQYFIPVKIEEDTPQKAGKVLYKNLKWVKDELNISKSGYNLFTINKGILKLSIKNKG